MVSYSTIRIVVQSHIASIIACTSISIIAQILFKSTVVIEFEIPNTPTSLMV
jgi:hypothetical protein